MKAVIFAAGEGKRMRPLTEHTPKPMVEVLGEPLLIHILNSLPKEIDQVIVVVGYLAEQIKSYFGAKFKNIKITYVYQSERLGSAHALWLCKDFLDEDERFLVLCADDLQSKEDIKKCLEYPRAILAKEVEDSRRFGVIVVDDSDRVLDIIEKPESPPSKLASTGVVVLDKHIFDYPASRHNGGEYYLTDSLTRMAKDHELKLVRGSFWFPIAYPSDVKKAEEILLQQHDI
jgi:bifunctional UDP-N-acetylglucosamine pyrophosphorylase/glucosamine-1-phosphate N-acetyltransferase